MNRRGRGGSLGLLLLALEVLDLGIENIPPVTLSSIALQVAIFLGWLQPYFPSYVTSVCISSYLVWTQKSWRRVVMAPVYHADDMHLYFNMLSFLIKGWSLERRYGSVYFVFMLAVFTVLTSVFYIAMGVLLANWMQDYQYLTECAVGFSGVVFALKVVTTHHTPHGWHFIFGFIPVPSRYIYWAELLPVQLVPTTSFRDHLAGIIVGLLYTKGPLKPLMDFILEPGSRRRRHRRGRLFWFSDDLYEERTRNRTYYSDNTEYGDEYSQGNTPGSQYYREGLYGNQQDGEQADYETMPQTSAHDRGSLCNLYPDLDEVRQRRTSRFHQNCNH